MDEKRQAALDRLQDVSPLEAASVLEELELYDSVSSIQIIDEVTEQFKSGAHLEDEVLKPVFMSVIDGLLEATSMGRAARKKGLTASRVVQECEAFSYQQVENSDLLPNGYVEWKNVGEQTRSDFEKHGAGKIYNRDAIADEERLKQYKKNKFKENNGRINAEDEYTGERNIYLDQDHSDGRRNTEKDNHAYRAEVDHIVPLKQIHEQFKGNYALTEADIKNIANHEDNYALTSARINRGAGAKGQGGKFESTNSEFIEDQRRREKEGDPNLGLSEEAKQRMLQKERDAQKALNDNADKAILANLTGRGTGNTKEIWGKTAKNAANQTKEYAVGNLILFIVKPLYYEVKDIFKNGLKDGVGASSGVEAFSIRFGRLKKHILTNAVAFLGDNMWEFVKGFISSLIEGIISLFVGMLKQVFKLLKEGIKIFVQASKVLWGEKSKEMSSAEKGDAIIKLIGGSVIAIAGIGIEFLLNKIGIGEPWSVVLSTMLSGIASALFMYLLDKADLFSVKSEKRRNRILEIFNERIDDIHKARDTWNITVLDALKHQRESFDEISNEIDYGLQINNIDVVNNGLFKMADFMKVNLEYSNLNEFCDYMNANKIVKL